MTDFGFILYPGMRSWAYLQVMIQLNLHPSLIICLHNSKNSQLDTALDKPWVQQHFFDPDFQLKQYLASYQPDVVHLTTESINDPSILAELNRSHLRRWLFSGGGVLKPHLFQDDHQFLHVHPGHLPDVRGSTCFYYSLLCDRTLFASSFWLTPELDAGEPIHISGFKVNLPAERLSPAFVDQVLDPWIRARCLYQTLKQWPTPKALPSTTHRAPSDRACYVMHPLLRALTLRKTARDFNQEQDSAVTEC